MISRWIHSCDQICVLQQPCHELAMIHHYCRPVSKQLHVCSGSDRFLYSSESFNSIDPHAGQIIRV